MGSSVGVARCHLSCKSTFSVLFCWGNRFCYMTVIWTMSFTMFVLGRTIHRYLSKGPDFFTSVGASSVMVVLSATGRWQDLWSLWMLLDTNFPYRLFSLGRYLWRSISHTYLAPPRKPGYMLVFFSLPALRIKKLTLLVFQKCQFKIHISVSTFGLKVCHLLLLSLLILMNTMSHLEPGLWAATPTPGCNCIQPRLGFVSTRGHSWRLRAPQWSCSQYKEQLLFCDVTVWLVNFPELLWG